MNDLATKVWQRPFYFLAFGFGLGLMPIAPGTWGTLAAIPFYLLLVNTPWYFYILLTLFGFIGGVYVCSKISGELGVDDYSGIVWDEVIGYLLTLFMVPFQWYWMIIGFILFRIFDIWKPQPIAFIEKKIKGGFGIMLDDVLAAIPAWLILQCLLWFFNEGGVL